MMPWEIEKCIEYILPNGFVIQANVRADGFVITDETGFDSIMEVCSAVKL